MNKREMQKFRKLLLAQGDHLLKGIRTIGQDSIESYQGDIAMDLTSFAEAGTDANDRETAIRLASGESAMLEEVAEALQRIEEGSYGKCIDCEKDIPKKRLEVFPAAKRCVECKSRYEKEHEMQ